MKIAVSIVSFNTENLLKKCLNSVFGSENKSDLEVWVVDNDSKDGSVEMIEKDFPKVHLIKNQENSGFAKGHNLALKKIKADLILILNSDTEVERNSLGKMIEFMKENDCDMASCKITNFNGNLQPNGGDLPFGIALISWLFNLEIFGNLPNFHRNETSYYANAHEIGWVSGSFLLVKDQVFDKIGFLNEDYFMYFEDVEFCYKAKQAGFKVMINPEVTIKHVGGASSKDPQFRQWSGEIKGLIYFYNKQFGFFSGILVKLLIYISMILRMIAYILMGKLHFAKTYGKIVLSI